MSHCRMVPKCGMELLGKQLLGHQESLWQIVLWVWVLPNSVLKAGWGLETLSRFCRSKSAGLEPHGLRQEVAYHLAPQRSFLSASLLEEPQFYSVMWQPCAQVRWAQWNPEKGWGGKAGLCSNIITDSLLKMRVRQMLTDGRDGSKQAM